MKLFKIRKDGGSESNVVGYWLIEWKAVFSIALLRFSMGSRENFHSHAFNSISWILWGHIQEQILGQEGLRDHRPSLLPVFIPRSNTHKVFGVARSTWAITFRGPWSDRWFEVTNEGRVVTLTHGRKVVLPPAMGQQAG